jgi:hypothetical protein
MTDPVDDLREHARELFGIFVKEADPSNWDWKPLAVKAMDAAEAFSAAVAERYALPAAESSGSPAIDPVPSDQAPRPAAVVSHMLPAVTGPPFK